VIGLREPLASAGEVRVTDAVRSVVLPADLLSWCEAFRIAEVAVPSTHGVGEG
jgi:hypothetical protein